jgi:hypothetical protein
MMSKPYVETVFKFSVLDQTAQIFNKTKYSNATLYIHNIKSDRTDALMWSLSNEGEGIISRI